MAFRRSDVAALFCARLRAPRNVGRAMAIRMPMIRTTTISSMTRAQRGSYPSRLGTRLSPSGGHRVASVERHGNRFRVVWRVDGVKRRRSFDTEAEARAFADNSLAIVGRYTIDISALVPAMPDRDRRPSPTVIEFARPLVEDPNLGAASRDIYRNALRKIDDSVLGETPL